jgi:hypothetical protein
LWYNLAREEKVHVSPSSVYRVLKSEDLVPPHVFGKPHRDKVKPDPEAPHEDWMIDITYIPIQAVDWYLVNGTIRIPYYGQIKTDDYGRLRIPSYGGDDPLPL